MAKSDEDKRVQAAAEAAKRRSKGKKGSSMTQYYIAGGLVIGFIAIAVFASLGGPSSSSKKSTATSPLAREVNEKSFVKQVTSSAAGNFTAAASPFFDRWSYADVKWGMDGAKLHGEGMIGMMGALTKCESEDDTEAGAIPPAYDLRTEYPECFGEVYDTGNCTASYAVAAASAISSRFCFEDKDKYGKVKLAPQQVLSCDKKSRGCLGGGIDSVFKYIQRRGLYPEECLPYVGTKGGECKTTCEESQKLKILDHCVLSGVKAMKREIHNRGPVVAPVYVKDEFLVYSSGVFTPTDHAVQQFGSDGEPVYQAVVVLGWGRADGTPYWLVRNSWGTNWGENGYARIAINSIVREGYGLVATPATDENIAAAEKKKEEEAIRKEQLKKERAERDARISEQKRQREEAMKAAQEDMELDELDDFEPEDDELAVDEQEDESASDEM